MTTTIRYLTALVALALWASPAAAGPRLFTPPIEVGGEFHCLECLVANVSNERLKVELTSYDEDGVATRSRVAEVEPGATTSMLASCDELGNFTCEFELHHGRPEQVRAASCEFTLSFGCGAAAAAH